MNLRTTCAAAVLLLAGAVAAHEVPAAQNQLSLAASANIEVTRDVLGIVFSTTREGAQAGPVQAELSQALEAVGGA
jgi:predicted secreted protein